MCLYRKNNGVRHKNIFVPNPVQKLAKNGEIDFNFMEAFIAALETYISVAELKYMRLSFG